MAINSVTISGNLTRDPAVRQTQGGTSVMTFGVAVNERRKNQHTGEWEDYANFVDCVMYGKRADALGRYLSKGSKVTVSGRLHYSSWEREGQRRSKLEVIVDELEFMSRQGGDSGRSSTADGVSGSNHAESAENGPQSGSQGRLDGMDGTERSYDMLYDEDIPF